MIPIRDNNPTRRFPYVVVALIAINILVFIGQELSRDPRYMGLAMIPINVTEGKVVAQPEIDTGKLVRTPWGIQPLRYKTPALSPPWLTIFTAMFLHGGLVHIAGNMLYLWIFGNNIEERLGHLGFLVFYIVCGVAAAYAHILSDPLSKLPTVGASGAVAGVLGAYFLLFPGAKVDTLLVGLFWVMVRIPAVIVLGMWFLIQIWSASVVATVGSHGGVAWWAHIGGFVTGMVLVFIFSAIFGPKRRGRRGAPGWYR